MRPCGGRLSDGRKQSAKVRKDGQRKIESLVLRHFRRRPVAVLFLILPLFGYFPLWSGEIQDRLDSDRHMDLHYDDLFGAQQFFVFNCSLE